jgi:hypothetical protein
MTCRSVFAWPHTDRHSQRVTPHISPMCAGDDEDDGAQGKAQIEAAAVQPTQDPGRRGTGILSSRRFGSG